MCCWTWANTLDYKYSPSCADAKQRHVQLNSHLRKPEWTGDAPFKMYQFENKWKLCLMRIWSKLTLCWTGFYSWQRPERGSCWRNYWDVDPASIRVNYTQWDSNHIWSLSAEGEPQCRGQAQWPWSQRLPLKSISASQHLPLLFTVTKEERIYFHRLFCWVPLFCLVTDILLGKKKIQLPGLPLSGHSK